MDGRTVGHIAGRMDGWMDGWMDGCLDGWMGRFNHMETFVTFALNLAKDQHSKYAFRNNTLVKFPVVELDSLQYSTKSPG